MITRENIDAAALRPARIRALREKENVSQTVFANYLNVTPGLVSKWERGEKRPSGASLKLLSLVQRRRGAQRLVALSRFTLYTNAARTTGRPKMEILQTRRYYHCSQ